MKLSDEYEVVKEELASAMHRVYVCDVAPHSVLSAALKALNSHARHVDATLEMLLPLVHRVSLLEDQMKPGLKIPLDKLPLSKDTPLAPEVHDPEASEYYDRLRQKVEWVINDMRYKAPEQAAACAPRWMDALKEGLEGE